MFPRRIYVVLYFLPILGIYNIVKGILYYIFAEGKIAIVAKKYVKSDFNSLCKISVNIEDRGEIITVPMVTDKDIEAGDEIMVWYLKKFKRCICDRKQPIKDGLIIIGLVVLCGLMFIAKN